MGATIEMSYLEAHQLEAKLELVIFEEKLALNE
jgi:hypothetical protein